MIKTKTYLTYVCDQCGLEEAVAETQDEGIDSRYSDYGGDFRVELKYKLPKLWTFTQFKKIVCGVDCLKSLWNKQMEKVKDEEITKYSVKFKEMLDELRK